MNGGMNYSDGYELYISEIVLEEIARGDKEAADRRIAITENLGEVGINNTALELANRLETSYE